MMWVLSQTFILTLTAYDVEGRAIAATNHYLADYRDGKTFVQTNWSPFDLSWMPANVAGLVGTLATTDVGFYGPNTPTYFALADFTYAYSGGADGIAAILSRHAGLRLGDQDVFVSVAGGAKAGEPAADLAVALAITSAFRGRPLGASVYAFGELGLTGVVRPVSGEERRLAAGLARGMRHGVIPNSDVDAPAGATKVTGIEDAIESAFRS